MTQLFCPWCGNGVNRQKAFKGMRDGKPVFLHLACNNTIAELNALKQQIGMIMQILNPKPIVQEEYKGDPKYAPGTGPSGNDGPSGPIGVLSEPVEEAPAETAAP